MKSHRFVWSIVLLVGLIILAAQEYWAVFGDLPSPEELPQRLLPSTIRITDRHGQVLYTVLIADVGHHQSVPLETIPIHLQLATIATEDRYFYQNPGVDIRGILRALWINLRGGETLAGGSTITQQLARNLLLSEHERTDRSVRRKLRESLLAWQLSRHYTKPQILGLYLNQIYYGAMTYGVEAAAQTYLGKSISELDLAESALLAGLPQAPARYNPFTDFEAAKARQGVVLQLMEQAGFISREQRLQAEREPLILASTPYPVEAAHFVMMVRSQLDRLYSWEKISQQDGWIVRTTLDLDWQHLAEQSVRQQIGRLKQGNNGLGHNVNNAALVALDPNTGEILALVGSPDYFDPSNSGAINMAITPRQPGSAIKPLVYAAALDPGNGQPWTAATMLLDVHTSFVTQDGKAYTPENYDRQEHGPVLLREALASSLNIPAVVALDHIGLETFSDLASDLGISTLNDPKRYDLSLALGGGEASLLELSGAYGAFANGGLRVEPFVILDIADSTGNLVYRSPDTARVRVLDEHVAWLINDILSDADARHLGFGPNSILQLDRPAAVKTGTTSNFHDNWTVGYTPDLVVGVWSGNTSYEPMREVNGLTGAAPIWHQFMRSVLNGVPKRDFQRPEGMAQVEICRLSGRLPGPYCPYRLREWFIAGTQPTEMDTIYRPAVIDISTGKLATSATPEGQKRQVITLDLPTRALTWARNHNLPVYQDLQVPGDDPHMADSAGVSGTILMVKPAQKSIYHLSHGLTPEAQQVSLEAVLAQSTARLLEVSIWVDGVPIVRVKRPQADSQTIKAWWQLSAGTHQAWAEAITISGERIVSETVTFQVIEPES